MHEWDPAAERRFAPDSAMWAVHTDVAMLVGGLRALLLQTLHPLALAGVVQHSTYKTDPLGRLHRTGAFVGTTTFGTVEESDQIIAQVKAIHARVNGTARDGREYSALDPTCSCGSTAPRPTASFGPGSATAQHRYQRESPTPMSPRSARSAQHSA